jgi:hypothetical protein
MGRAGWAAGAFCFVTSLVAAARAVPPTITQWQATVSNTNVVTLNWATQNTGPNTTHVYINQWTLEKDDPNFLGNWDLGFRPLDCLPQAGNNCTVSVRVHPGVRRFTIGVNGEGFFDRVTQDLEVTIPAPAPPVPISPKRVSIDMFNVPGSTNAQRTISWQLPATGYVTINGPGVSAQVTPPASSFVVPAAALALGPNVYNLVYCQTLPALPALGETQDYAWCSEAVPVTFAVEASQFNAPSNYRLEAPSGQALNLTWNGSAVAGAFWVVDAPTLGIWEWVSTPSYLIPANKMVPGFHDIRLVSAVWGGAWSNHVAEVHVPQGVQGTAHCLHPLGLDMFPNFSRFIRVTAPSTPPSTVNHPEYCNNAATGADVDILAPALGTPGFVVNDGAALAPGQHVGFVQAEFVPYIGHRQVTVYDPAQPPPLWQIRSFETDFADRRFYPVYNIPTAGIPIAVFLDQNGDTWNTTEFGSALVHARKDGTITRHEVPLAGVWNADKLRFERVKPFKLFGNATIAGGGERVVGGGGYVWFGMGGGYGDAGEGNHSRIVRYNPSGTDDPLTEWDDRMCVYNVPVPNLADPAHAQNWVIGVAWDEERGRLWFTEADPAHAALSWFKPSLLPCDNFLDYSSLTAIQNAVHQYCTPAQDANENAACIHKIDFSESQTDPSLKAVVDPFHLVVDLAEDAVWFGEWSGQMLTRFDIATKTVKRFPLSRKNAKHPFTLLYGASIGHPLVDQNYVYFNEYADSDLARFDKSTWNDPACLALDPAGRNPCMSEVHLPVPDVQTNMAAHSIDIDQDRKRVWFSFVQDQKNGPDAAIGWVNLAGTNQAEPELKPGVLYTGLGALVDTTRKDVGPASFSGISVDRVTGKVAAGDFHRKQILLLCPTTCDPNAVDLTPPNSTFETDSNSDGVPNSWTKVGTGVASLPSETFSGKAVKLLPNTAAAAPGNEVFLESGAIPLGLTPPATSKIVVTVAGLTSAAINLARVDVNAYANAAGTGGILATYTASITGTPGQFKRYTFKSTSFPATAQSIRVRLRARDHLGRYAEFDDLRVALVY